MGRVVETRLVLTGEDRGAAKMLSRVEGAVGRTSKAFAGLERADKAAAAVDRVAGALDRVAETDALRTKLAAAARAMDTAGKASGAMGAQVKKDAGEIAREFDRTARAINLSEPLRRDIKNMQLTRRELGLLARDAGKMAAATEKALGNIGNAKVREQIVAAERATMEARLRERAKGLSEARHLEERFTRELGGHLQTRERAFREHHLRMGRVFKESAAYLGAGGALYGAGRALTSGARAAADQSRERARDYLAGRAEDTVRIDREALALSSRYKSVDSNTFHERLRDMSLSMGSIDKALAVSDSMARSMTVLQSLKGRDAAIEEGRKFDKALDTFGKNIDPATVRKLMDGFVKALGVEGAELNYGELLQAAKMSKSAGPGLGEEFLATVAPGLMTELGGARFGTALSSSYAQLIGGRSTKKSLAYQEKIGMRDAQGQISAADRDLIASNPYAYTRSRLMPMLEKSGVDLDNTAAVGEAMSKIFSNQVVANLYTQMVTQRDQIDRRVGQYRKAPGLAAADELAQRDPYVAAAAASAQFRNAMAELGDAVMPAATKALNLFADGANALARYADENPLKALAGTAVVGAGGVIAGKKALGALDAFGLRRSATELSGAARDLRAAAGALGGGGFDADGSGDRKRPRGRGGRSILGGIVGAAIGGVAADQLSEMLGDESGWLATASSAALGAAAWGAPAATFGFGALVAGGGGASVLANEAVKKDPNAFAPNFFDPNYAIAAGIYGADQDPTKAIADAYRTAPVEDKRDLDALRADKARLQKRLDEIQSDRAAVPGGESAADLDALEAEIRRDLAKIGSLVVRRGADAGFAAVGSQPLPTRATGYGDAPIPSLRPGLEDALKDARPVGEEAGRAAGEGVAEGVRSKAPRLRAETLDMLQLLQQILSLNPLRIPMSLDPSGLGGFGGAGGLINASFGGGAVDGRGSFPILSGSSGGGALAGRSGNGGGAFGTGAPITALPVGEGTGLGHVASRAERAAYIREAARREGVDPEIALRVAQSEGFNTYVGDQGRSFGDWQLFTGGGLGNKALAAGINIRDPKTWREQTDFALKHAAREGWGDWKGARKVGIAPWHGIGGVGVREKGAVSEIQGVVANIRRLPIAELLRNQIDYAASQAGVRAEVYSGGQSAEGPREGGHRHDDGRAADLRLYVIDENGRKRYLSMDDPADRAVMQTFIRNSVKAGASGIGSGPGYMGEHGIHVGGGSALSWGAGGRSANAPDWVRRAHKDGLADRTRQPIDLDAWVKDRDQPPFPARPNEAVRREDPQAPAETPAPAFAPEKADRLDVFDDWDKGPAGMMRAAERMNEAADRFNAMRLNTLHTIELTGSGRDNARVKGMKATGAGPITADMGISMPQTRGTRTA